MNIAERYTIQRNFLKNKNIFSKNSFPTIENYIDRYIISMAETNDNRRYLLDKKEYSNIMDSIEADVYKRIEQAVNGVCSGINIK